jgi:hypothetical protein
MIKNLKIARERWRSISPLSSMAAFISPLVLNYHDFLALFSPSSLLGAFSCILLMYLGAPYGFNDIWIPLKKKVWIMTKPFFQCSNKCLIHILKS